jgi:hypothetical protein
MSEELQGRRGRAVELLELHDSLDLLDQELRVRKIVLLLTPLVSTVLAVPLFIVLFINEARLFAAYPSTFIVALGAILYAVTVERRRLREERQAVRNRIRQMEDPPPPQPRLRAITCDPSGECLLPDRTLP